MSTFSVRYLKTKNFKPKNITIMKVYQTNEIKNIALLGSAGSGKTTLKLASSSVAAP